MSVRNLAAFAGVLMLSASAALAQEANYNPAAYTADNEQVIVTAPGVHLDHNPLSGPADRATLSREVAFNDLDLRKGHDARVLRQRVRDTAREICDTLRYSEPNSLKGETCYGDMLSNAMPRAEAAIREARYSARYR